MSCGMLMDVTRNWMLPCHGECAVHLVFFYSFPDLRWDNWNGRFLETVDRTNIFLLVHTSCCISFPVGRSQTVVRVKKQELVWDCEANCMCCWILWTISLWATALVNIPAATMSITHSLKNCGIELCDKAAYFQLAFMWSVQSTPAQKSRKASLSYCLYLVLSYYQLFIYIYKYEWL